VAVAVISLLVVWQYRRDALRFFVGAALVALPFFAFSLGVFGRVLPPYYRGHYILALDIQAVLEALAGLLVSPNRGLFTFSPFLLFGLVGLGLKLRDRSLSLLDAALFVIVGLHWLVMGAYINWYAGHSFGPRYMSDVLPFLMFFLIP